jgi:pre-mRNA-splicing helicase BRR2
MATDRGRKPRLEDGGSEQYARAKQYQYSATSNLVIQGERPRGGPQEGTGEVESLRGRLSGKMGDRAVSARSKEMDDKLDKMKKRKAEKGDKSAVGKKPGTLRPRNEPSSILQATEEMESLAYIPKTRETRLAYEQILTLAQGKLGDVSSDILKGVANEIIATMKDDKKKDSERKKEIELMLSGTISTEDLARLHGLARSIVDWSDEGAKGNDTLDEEHGVAVVFGEDADGAEEGSEGSDAEFEVCPCHTLPLLMSLFFPGSRRGGR